MPNPEHAPPVEAACRRENFRGDVPIVLSDGATWYLPRPRVSGRYLVPYAHRLVMPNGAELPPEDRTAECGITEFGAEYDFRAEEMLINHFNNDVKTPELDWFARFLLRVNYQLTDRDFYYLLRLIPGDPDNLVMWAEIMAVALDRIFVRNDADPKAPGPAGANSSSGPPTASSSTGSP